MSKLKPIPVAITVILLVVTMFNACKKDKSGPVDITGKWVHQYAYQNTQVYQEIYQFNTDSTYTQSRIIADSVSGQTISYQYIATGKFHLSSDQLQLYSITGKYNGYYVPLNQLVPVATPIGNINYTIAIKSDLTSFHFVYPPCPINASCIGEFPYYKK